MSDEYGVFLFNTTSAALKGEKVLKRAGFAVKLIPVPRELSSECGLALRFFWREAQATAEALRAGGVEAAGSYPI